MYPPIAVVQIDSYSKLNKIHAIFFWVCMVATIGAFIDYQIRYNFRMDVSTSFGLIIYDSMFKHNLALENVVSVCPTIQWLRQ